MIESSSLDEARTTQNELQLPECIQPYAQGFHHHEGCVFSHLPSPPELRV